MDHKVTTAMPRAALPSSDRTEDVVFWIGFAVSALFVAAQIAFAVSFVPVVLYAYETAALEMPVLLRAADALGPLGIVLVLSAFDLVVFGVFAAAARRYWRGLLFIPPLLYMLGLFVLFMSGLSGAAVILAR